MNVFNNLKIGAKILCGFFLVAIIATVIGITGIMSINTINDKDTQMYEKMTVPMSNLYNMNQAFQNTRSSLRDMILSSNVSEISTFEGQVNDNKATYAKNSSDFSKTMLSDAGKQGIIATDASIAAYEKIAVDVISLAKANKDAQAIALMNTDGSKANDLVAKNMQNLNDLKIALAKTTADDNSTTAASSRNLMLIFIVIGAVLAIILGVLISRSITTPIKKLVDYANKIALGDVDIEITHESKDEVGTLMVAFRKMIKNIHENVASAQNIASGDFNVEIKPKSDKDILAKSMVLVVEAVKNLEVETDMLITASLDGNYLYVEMRKSLMEGIRAL
jgi:methyl-accepting chemotaxis protein